jgi:tetratricopeptide (TPR) repeat protein
MDQFTAHLDRGWDLVNRGDFPGALLSAQKSLELDPESPEAHNLIGYIHQAEGRSEDALDHFRQAIAIDETYVEAMLNAAEVLIHAMRDYESGLSMVDEALDFAEGADEVADAQLLRFDALMQQGDREGAVKLAKDLPEGPFEGGHLDFMIGRAKFETGDLDGAEKHLTRAVHSGQADGQPGDAYYYQGLVREARGDLRGATICFLQAREADLHAPRPGWSISQSQFERQVQAAVKRLPESLATRVEDALVVVSDMPGPEVVAEGVDPHVGVLVDDLLDKDGAPVPTEDGAQRAGRVFVYQRNIERWAESAERLEDEVLRALEHELSLTFPDSVPR